MEEHITNRDNFIQTEAVFKNRSIVVNSLLLTFLLLLLRLIAATSYDQTVQVSHIYLISHNIAILFRIGCI